MSAHALRLTSSVLGWIYTLLWSLSFYPQPLLNLRRRSTSGASVDFPAINTLGFLAYSASNAAFAFSAAVRAQYAARNRGLAPTVRGNDVAFAAHALVLSVATWSMFWPGHICCGCCCCRGWGWGFDRGGKRGAGARLSRGVVGVMAGCCVGVAAVAVVVAAEGDADPATGWAAIDVVYACSYVKLFITLVKFVPQVLANYRNGSTHGWAIDQILLDVGGGVLSIAQLGIDSYLQHDWSGITGNPVKFALGIISLFFDAVFIAQHYVLYRGKIGEAYADDELEENDSLMRSDERRLD